MKHRHRNIMSPIMNIDSSEGFFDGVTKNGLCGESMVLFIKRGHNILLKMGAGKGTNIREKILSLWRLMWFSLK